MSSFPSKKIFDAAIIGGGFYGSIIALFLKKSLKNVVILEKESDLLLKASYNNQARIHNGYHYPRSLLTALRSHINYSRFISDFKEVVTDNFLMTYAVATNNSKISSQQFMKFCKQIGSPIKPASKEIKSLFDNRLIEGVFIVKEAVYNADRLREILKQKLSSAKVSIFYQSEVLKVTSKAKHIIITLKSGKKIVSHTVINCTYSNTNNILKNSNLPLLPLRLELTEMPLIKLPNEIKKMGITIIDGPFFSVMPFPSSNLHTFHHVRYTPHDSTLNISKRDNFYQPKSLIKKSKFIYMIKDAKRYVPLLDKAQYKGSLYETKALLTQTESTDARPILFKKDHGIKNFHVILGGKIDNIYDMVSEMENYLKGQNLSP